MEFMDGQKCRMRSGSHSATGVPSDVIDNRIIYLGDVKAGAHKVMIRVPSAKFNEKKGDIPVSMYFHGAVNGVGDAGIHVPEAVKPRVNVSVADGMLSMEADAEILAVELFSAQGDCVYKRNSASPVLWMDMRRECIL